MPTYQYYCNNGHITEGNFSIKSYPGSIECFNCAEPAGLIISAPMLVKASADVRYTSPIDERPITSWQARQEDLKRNNCTEYDPEQKTDYHNRIKESEAALDKSIDIAVESSIEKMPTAKRGKLYSELTEQGVTTSVVKGTYAG